MSPVWLKLFNVGLVADPNEHIAINNRKPMA